MALRLRRFLGTIIPPWRGGTNLVAISSFNYYIVHPPRGVEGQIVPLVAESGGSGVEPLGLEVVDPACEPFHRPQREGAWSILLNHPIGRQPKLLGGRIHVELQRRDAGVRCRTYVVGGTMRGDERPSNRKTHSITLRLEVVLRNHCRPGWRYHLRIATDTSRTSHNDPVLYMIA